MKIYPLYLESGPRHKKTMVHVLDLLGCTASGSTTEAALENTPEAIRIFLKFLHRHGQPANPDEAFSTEVVEHITEGVYLGNGDPALVFQPDLSLLADEDLENYIQRLSWMHEDMAALIAGLDSKALAAKPPRGRPIQAILSHILESEYNYMRAFGKLEELPGLTIFLKRSQEDLVGSLARMRTLEYARLRALSIQKRWEPFIHWGHTRTARKVIRRMLEHQWEHFVEIAVRLDKPI